LVVAVLAACAGSPFVRVVPSPSSSPSLVNSDPKCKGVKLLANRTYDHIAVYRWRKSGTVYVAEPTGLDGSLATGAEFTSPNDMPSSAVTVTFNPRGQQLLHEVTAEAAAASHRSLINVPEGYLAVLVGLTDEQIANWSDPVVQKKALRPVEEGGNLLVNAIVRDALSGNQLNVYQVKDLPTACSLTAKRTA
jgi:hypothetical protein